MLEPQSVLKGAVAAEVQPPEGAGEMAAKDRAKAAEPVQVVVSSGLPASEDNPVLPAVADSQDLLWCELLIQTGIGGVAYAMASNCVLAAMTETSMDLHLAPAHASLFNETQAQRLSEAVSRVKEQSITVTVRVAASDRASPAMLLERERTAGIEAAQTALAEDVDLQALMSGFDATFVEGTVMPNQKKGEG